MNTPTPPIDKDALIASLLERIEVLMAQNAALAARVAELEAKLGLPPKTPDNSSLPHVEGSEAVAALDRRSVRPSPIPAPIGCSIPTRPATTTCWR